MQEGARERGSSLARLLFYAARACTLQDRAIFVWSWKIHSVSVRCLFYEPVDEKIKAWLLRFPAKENPHMEKALLDWPVVLQYDVKAKYRLISRKFSDIKFCHPSVRLTSQKPRTFLYPFDKPIKSLYFRLFVISVLFSRFSVQGHTKIALFPKWRACSHLRVVISAVMWTAEETLE